MNAQTQLDKLALRSALDPNGDAKEYKSSSLYDTLWRVRALLRTVARYVVDGEGFMPDPIDKTNAYTLVYKLLHVRSSGRFEVDYRELLYDEAVACMHDVLHRLVHKYDHLRESQTGRLLSRRQYTEVYFDLRKAFWTFAKWVCSTFSFVHANRDEASAAHGIRSAVSRDGRSLELASGNRCLKLEVAARHLFARAVATTDRIKRAPLLARESLFAAPGTGLYRGDDPLLSSAPLTLFEEVARNPDCFPWLVDMAVRINDRVALPNAVPCEPTHPAIAEKHAQAHAQAITLLFRRAEKKYAQLHKGRLQTRAALYELMRLQSRGRARLLLPEDDALGVNLRVFERLHAAQDACDEDSLLHHLYDRMVGDDYQKELDALTYFVRRNMFLYPSFGALVKDVGAPLGWGTLRVVEKNDPSLWLEVEVAPR